QLREAYADIKSRTIPLTIRAGRQQIVWGETDNFRMLDRANPLDLTWHFQQEIPAPAFGWDQIRRPLWMFKFLYDLGDVWKLSQNFLEWYWNPGDWFPAKSPFGLEFTLNYFYQRWSGDDGTNYAPIRGLAKNDVNNARAVQLYTKGIFPAEFIAPYVHTLGLSANYSDEAYTQTVFRAETAYDVGIPFFDLQKITVLDVPAVPGVT